MLGTMRTKALFFILLSLFSPSLALVQDAEITIEAVTSIAITDSNFICATIDWWPETKCNYDQCPWGKAGLVNLDLTNKILINAVKAFNPLRIRIGGSLQDQLYYNVGNAMKQCPHFKRMDGFLFGFSHGCLDMKRWDEINNLFNETGALMIFGLNALFGRHNITSELWVGDWDSRNARDLMKYTISKGYKIDAYELGNELSASGVSARVEAAQYAKDMIVLRNIVNELYPDPTTRPKVLGPGGFFDIEWFQTLLKGSGQDVIDGVTHHIYNLGAGNDKNLIYKIQDPFFLNQIAHTYKDAATVVRDFGPWSGAWVGEAGGAYNSGGKGISNTFVDGFWYMDQLGMTSAFNHKVYCRQALIGGNYPLLDTTTFVPNPDYYGALLWHRLMGKRVLSARHGSDPRLRVYAHCSKDNPGNMTLMVINMSNSTSFNIKLLNDQNLYPDFSVSSSHSAIKASLARQYAASENIILPRQEYHLTPKDGNIQSNVVLLNGAPLSLTESLDIPEMKPKLVDPYSTLIVAPDSIVFATSFDFSVPACS